MATKKAKSNSIHFQFTKSLIILYIIIAVILTGLTYFFKSNIENLLNYSSFSQTIDYNGLVMHTVNVGQAEAIIIKLPDNKNLMIDSGNNNSTSRTKLLNYLENKFFPSTNNSIINYFILTHSDADHVGGVKAVFDAYKIENVYRPKIYSSQNEIDNAISTSHEKKVVGSNIYAEAINSIYNENCNIYFSISGIKITAENYEIVFYAPNQDYYTNVNDFSPIVVITYNNKTIMLTGDATSKSESEVLDNFSLPKVDILKVAHHGSKTSSSMNFLNQINPSCAIISCGEKSKYGHPNVETINSLCEFMRNDAIYTTYDNGDIVANISTNADIAILVDINSAKAYIRAEYVLLPALVFLFITFFVKTKSKQKKLKT